MDQGKAMLWSALIGAAVSLVASGLAFLDSSKAVSIANRISQKFEISLGGSTQASISRVAQEASRLIDQTIRLSGGSITCEDDHRENSYRLSLFGRGELYPPNMYEIASSSEAQLMSNTVLRIIQLVERLSAVDADVSGITINGVITGHADALEILNANKFDGLAQLCNATEIGGENKANPTQHDMGAVDSLDTNRLLACARAAEVAEYLANRTWTLPQFQLLGRAHKSPGTGGFKRAIDVEVNFRNILKADPSFDLCAL